MRVPIIDVERGVAPTGCARFGPSFAPRGAGGDPGSLGEVLMSGSEQRPEPVRAMSFPTEERPRRENGDICSALDLSVRLGAGSIRHEAVATALAGTVEMIRDDERARFRTLLAQMRTLHDELDERQAGLCVLHLDAAIAALESHLRRNGVPLEQRRPEPTGATEPIG